MRLCVCGYSCGTAPALERHLARAIHPHCEAIEADEAQDEALEADMGPDVRLLRSAKAGYAAEVREALKAGANLTTLGSAPLSAAVQGGHISAAHVLIRHCRGRRYSPPLDGVNVVANTLNWAASGYCSTSGPEVIAMLRNERHLDALRKGPLDLWQRMSALLGGSSPSRHLAENDESDDPFTLAGRAALTAAQRAAVPPSHHATWQSARARRPGAAKLEASELVADQIHLIANGLDRKSWSPEVHQQYPPRFRASVREVVLASRRPECVLSRLPGDDVLLYHIIAVIASRTYWELGERCVLRPAIPARSPSRTPASSGEACQFSTC